SRPQLTNLVSSCNSGEDFVWRRVRVWTRRSAHAPAGRRYLFFFVAFFFGFGFGFGFGIGFFFGGGKESSVRCDTYSWPSCCRRLLGFRLKTACWSSGDNPAAFITPWGSF